MIRGRSKKMPKATSAYKEKKAKPIYFGTDSKKEIANFCINQCPHKNKPCGSHTCAEYREFLKALKEKYNN